MGNRNSRQRGKSKLLPFPRPFPTTVLEQIFSYLDSRERIKLECLSKECFKLLRPNRCPLPTLKQLDLTVRLPPRRFTDNVFWDYESIDIRARFPVFFARNSIIVTSKNYEKLLVAQERLTRQIPFGQIKFEQDCREPDYFFHLHRPFLECIARNCTKIYRLELTFVSIVNMGLNRDFWCRFWNKLPNLETLFICDLRMDENCSIDEFLIDIVNTGQLRDLKVQRVFLGPAVTDRTLIALATNGHRIRRLYLSDLEAITVGAVANLILALASEPIQQPIDSDDEIGFFMHDRPMSQTQKCVALVSCSIDKQQLGQLINKVINNKYGSLIKVEPDRLCGFANHNLFFCIHN